MKIWLICYDISDNKRRYYIDKILQGYGERIQKSAFECLLKSNEMNLLQKELKKHITMEDAIHYYPLCRWCQEKRQGQGSNQVTRYQGFYIS
jgi:CRISPR-associated protein Cas2